MEAQFVSASRRNGVFRYSTGSRLPGIERAELQLGRLSAQASYAFVTVKAYSENPDIDSSAANFAYSLAISTASAIRGIWPRQDVPVEFEIVFVEDSLDVYQRIRRIRRIGEPWRLRFYKRQRDLDNHNALNEVVSVFAHEFYHLLAAEYAIGRSDQRASNERAGAYFYEEISAFLFQQCSVLMGMGITSTYKTPISEVEFYADGDRSQIVQTMTAPFPDHFVRGLHQMVREADEQGFGGMSVAVTGIGLTLWSEISGGSWTIEAGTPQAERLLEVCRRVAPDPFEVRALIEELAADGVDAPPLPPRPRHAGPPPPDAGADAAGTGAAEPEAGAQPDAAREDEAA